MRKRKRIGTALIVLLLALALAAVTIADSGIALPWRVLPGGGGESTAPGLILNGSIGQPATGTLAGGAYQMQSGFWPGMVEAGPAHTGFLPLTQR